MNIVGKLFKIARIARDIEVVSSGNPKKIATRAVNSLRRKGQQIYINKVEWELTQNY